MAAAVQRCETKDESISIRSFAVRANSLRAVFLCCYVVVALVRFRMHCLARDDDSHGRSWCWSSYGE